MSPVTPKPADDVDSRTASFERKRPYSRASHDSISNDGPVASTPRKRVRHPESSGLQDRGDFESPSDDCTSPRPRGQANGDTNHRIVSDQLQHQHDDDASNRNNLPESSAQSTETHAPPALGPLSIMSWNVGKAPEMRLSQEQVQVNQAQATKIAYARYQGLQERLSSLDRQDLTAENIAIKELHNAEVDYQYCQHFPRTEEFLPLPGFRALDSVTTTSTALKQEQIWRAAEQCMKDGTLEDLRDGNIVGIASYAPKSSLRWKQESSDPKQNQMLETQEAFRRMQGYFAGKKGAIIQNRDNKLSKERHEAQVDLNYCQYYPINKDYQSLALAKAELEGQNEGISAAVDGTPAQMWKMVEHCMGVDALQLLKDGQLGSPARETGMSNDPSSLSRTDDSRTSEEIIHGQPSSASSPDPLSFDYGMKPNGNGGERVTSPEIITSYSHDSSGLRSTVSSDEHQHCKGAKSPENHEGPPKIEAGAVSTTSESGHRTCTSSDDDDHNNEDDDSSDSESDMFGYSELEQHNSLSNASNQAPHHASTLANLGSEDLNAQIRYFHITKDPQSFYRNLPVRCLVCAQTGHMAAVCEVLTCKTCNAHNKHTTADCSMAARCGKCREKGHKQSDCPYKLKKLSREEAICDLCQRQGHIETECELLWRTSGKPWNADYSGKQIQLFCYECGLGGHLGNDCSARRPGKPFATSSWSLNSLGQAPRIASGEMNIKGRAQQQSTSAESAYEDGHANFYQKKIPEPARKGNIRINIGSNKSTDRSSVNQSLDAIRSHPIEAPRQAIHTSYPEYSRYPNINAYQSKGYNTDYNDSRYPHHKASYPDGRYQQPTYQPTYQPTFQQPAPYYPQFQFTHGGGGDSYRPMPSAARNAWNRHRV